MNIVVFVASDLEYNIVKKTLTNWKSTDYQKGYLSGQGYCKDNFIELFCTKMGPINAERQAKKVLENTKKKVVLVVGLGGGLTLQCKQGDLVIYKTCYLGKEDKTQLNKISCEEKLVEQLHNNLMQENMPVYLGDGITFSKVVCQAQEKLSISKTYQTNVVDMESYQILEIAQEKKLPATVLRVISDDASGDLPNLNAAMDQYGNVNNLKIILQFAKHPILAAKFLINLNKSVSILKNCLPKVLGGNFAGLC